MTENNNSQKIEKQPDFSCMIGIGADGWCGKCGCYHYHEKQNRGHGKSKAQRAQDHLKITITITIAGETVLHEVDEQPMGNPDDLYGIHLARIYRRVR